MLDAVPLRPQVQTLQMQVRRLQLSEQQRVQEYTDTFAISKDILGDLATAQTSINVALGDKGDKNVAGDGKKINAEMNEAKSRIATNRAKMTLSLENGRADTPVFMQVRQLAEGLANLPGLPPGVQVALRGAFDGVAMANLKHQSGNRYMSWALPDSHLGERELNYATNSVRNVMADNANGKNVSGDAAQVDFRFREAGVHLKEYNQYLGQAGKEGGDAVQALGYALTQIDEALGQLPETP